MDLVIRRAKLRNRERVVDIGVQGRRIAAIAERLEARGDREIEAAGRLVAPSFVDPHMHLDKAFTSERAPSNVSGTVGEAVRILRALKGSYTIEDIVRRASRTIELAVSHGTTYIRTHVDVDGAVRLLGVEALLLVRDRYAGIVDLQIVAYPQEGINDETAPLLREAVAMGADLVGGGPEIGLHDWPYDRHIDTVFEIAAAHGADVDLHLDLSHDPASRAFEYFARRAIAAGYQGRTTASHAAMLESCNEYYAHRLIELLREAEMHVITCPTLNLLVHGRLDRGIVRRGLTRVRDLHAAGINVAYGSDNIMDPFNPTLGRADPLEIGLVGALAIQWSLPAELDLLFDMATENGARIMGIADYGIHEGAPADLNVLDCADVAQAFRDDARPRFVIKGGRVLVEREHRVDVVLT
ncbi:MAG TPA: amidohydrolase family protein [bacterium]